MILDPITAAPDARVSVIVPAYCHEDYILDCLVSIHDQTYHDLELVVIDDCSTDRTFERVGGLLQTAFARRFSNVVAHRNVANIGAHATIGKGIAASGGDYIAVINSDDLFRPTRIARILEAMNESKSGIGFSLVKIIGTAKTVPGSLVIPDPFLLYPQRLAFNLQRDPTVGFALLRENVAVSTGNLVFSRKLYNSVGGFTALEYCHDWDFVLQSLFYTEPAIVLEPLYDYRLHEQNSFSALVHRGELETEVVMRRFFRRGIRGISPNPLFPSAQNWPGFFEAFVEAISMTRFLNREWGLGSPGWRIYDAPQRIIENCPNNP